MKERRAWQEHRVCRRGRSAYLEDSPVRTRGVVGEAAEEAESLGGAGDLQ